MVFLKAALSQFELSFEMETRDFYVVLGVPATETSAGIRHAFRELATRYHPDRAGAQGTRFFQDVVEAYRVLSDSKRRASFDEGLRHAGVGETSRPPISPAFYPEPEPLVPVRRSLFRDFVVTRPSFDEIFDRFLRSFTEPSYPKSQRLDALNLELHLTPVEAAGGGALDLGVPVFYPCRVCHGSGESAGYDCRSCGGQGIAEDEEYVRIAFPPMVGDGTMYQIPLRGLGIHNLRLQLLVRVGEAD
jgi:DnaJ-class molecular chaperone